MTEEQRQACAKLQAELRQDSLFLRMTKAELHDAIAGMTEIELYEAMMRCYITSWDLPSDHYMHTRFPEIIEEMRLANDALYASDVAREAAANKPLQSIDAFDMNRDWRN